MPLSFQEKLQSGYYSDNNYEYVSAKEARNDPAKARQRELYGADTARRHAEFKADVLEEVGLTGHPKADKVFEKAWEMCHSAGYSEVTNYMYDLADLVL